MTTAVTDQSIIVLFDGVCNLCNGTVQFIIRRDPQARFRFASLQSATGQRTMQRFGLDPGKLESVVVIDDGKLYQRSEAVLRILQQLRGWKWLTAFRIVPRFIRDSIYDVMAGNRYSVFGKRDQCMIPTPELRSRFLE